MFGRHPTDGGGIGQNIDQAADFPAAVSHDNGRNAQTQGLGIKMPHITEYDAIGVQIFQIGLAMLQSPGFPVKGPWPVELCVTGQAPQQIPAGGAR